MNGKQFAATVAAIALAIVLAGLINSMVLPKIVGGGFGGGGSQEG